MNIFSYSRKSHPTTITITLALLLLGLFLNVSLSIAANHTPLHFFGSANCKDCIHIKQKILFPAQNKYPHIALHIHDVSTDSGFNLLMQMEDAFNVPQSAAIELFFPDTFLSGAEDIRRYAPELIVRCATDITNAAIHPTTQSTENFSRRLFNKFRSYSFISILIAGIIDGINPCALATMIFLISFLATQKRKRSEILTIGLSFTAAVFLTYFAMGIGAFKALTFLQRYGWISSVVRWGAASLAIIIGLLSFRDACSYHKTGKAGDIKMQLPKVVKMRIHKAISGNLSGRSLFFGAISTGFIVTLLEAVCTGQVYLPTIVLMTRQDGLRLTGWFYLIFYNILFVLPLLIVMILAYFGLRWDRLAKTTQKNIVPIKLALGILLCGLGGFLILAG